MQQHDCAAAAAAVHNPLPARHTHTPGAPTQFGQRFIACSRSHRRGHTDPLHVCARSAPTSSGWRSRFHREGLGSLVPVCRAAAATAAAGWAAAAQATAHRVSRAWRGQPTRAAMPPIPHLPPLLPSPSAFVTRIQQRPGAAAPWPHASPPSIHLSCCCCCCWVQRPRLVGALAYAMEAAAAAEQAREEEVRRASAQASRAQGADRRPAATAGGGRSAEAVV